jgi:hypothetical protein
MSSARLLLVLVTLLALGAPAIASPDDPPAATAAIGVTGMGLGPTDAIESQMRAARFDARLGPSTYPATGRDAAHCSILESDLGRQQLTHMIR